MKCSSCGGVSKVTATTHRYVESGLPSVVLSGVQVRTCAACGEHEVAIPNLAGLHRSIALSIVHRRSALTGAELRFLRQFLGRSSKDFAKILGIVPETFTRWQTGERVITPAADRLVRLLVLHTQPRTDYSEEMLAAIRPTPPKRPRIALRLRGDVWEETAAA